MQGLGRTDHGLSSDSTFETAQLYPTETLTLRLDDVRNIPRYERLYFQNDDSSICLVRRFHLKRRVNRICIYPYEKRHVALKKGTSSSFAQLSPGLHATAKRTFIDQNVRGSHTTLPLPLRSIHLSYSIMPSSAVVPKMRNAVRHLCASGKEAFKQRKLGDR
jgi:hypothetical protein